MNIHDDTKSYEGWLGRLVDLNKADLKSKHEGMADPRDPFPFFRATYYRWARRWPEVCAELINAPRVLAVGDAHIENFGTWRDADGRLAWGINDFDEADTLPFTNDLVRLACSLLFAQEANSLSIHPGRACRAIVDGYQNSLDKGGRPFVLEGKHALLRSLAYAQERDPASFWKKLTKLLDQPRAQPPAEARRLLLRQMPAKNVACEFRFRYGVGMGSLGKPRFAALADWSGGWVAREVKALTPPATDWLAGKATSHLAKVLSNAVRSPDPFYQPEKRWLSRRLAPRCSRIELSDLSKAGDQAELLEAMGAELANVHLGTGRQIKAVKKDLARRSDDWLKDAAVRMFKAMKDDWQGWKTGS
jgi:hypothetical protein